MTDARVLMVDVFPVRGAEPGLEVLVLRRGAGGRNPGAWETVHGHIEVGETAVEAARRELREETGFAPVRLYNLSRIDGFYLHRVDRVALVPAFAAFVDPSREVRLSAEHDAAEWLRPEAACARWRWPRLRRGLEDLMALVGSGDAGDLEDVLRIC